MTAIGPRHRQRLRRMWRSAGWPCQDGIELELLAAGLLARVTDDAGRDTLRVTDQGIATLAGGMQLHRAARSPHEALAAQVARAMQRAGRIVWRGLGLRAKVDDAWCMAVPDVYSIRHTTLEDALEPAVHEVKVQRADLLADLRRAAKGAAYRALSSQCWYVLGEGIADPDEIPPQYGVMVACADGLQVARAAPRRPMRVPFHLWMALARAAPEPPDEDDLQRSLGDPGDAQSDATP